HDVRPRNRRGRRSPRPWRCRSNVLAPFDPEQNVGPFGDVVAAAGVASDAGRKLDLKLRAGLGNVGLKRFADYLGLGTPLAAGEEFELSLCFFIKIHGGA